MTVPNAGLTLTFGNGALPGNTTVDFAPLVAALLTASPTLQQVQDLNQDAVQALADQNVPPPPTVASGNGVIQSLFSLDATNTVNGAEVNTFNAPVTLAIVVPAGTLSLAGGNLANVQVFRFNETTRVWTQVSCTSGASGLNCSTSGFSIWALVVATQVAPQPAPVAPRPAATGTGLKDESMSVLPLVGLVLLAGTMAGAGAYAVQRRRP